MSEREAGGVAVVVEEAPEGVRKFTALVTLDGGEVASVEPGALAAHFEVTDGGPGDRRVRARAVDFQGEAGDPDGPVTLLTVRFAEPLAAGNANLTLESLVDHAGEEIDRGRVRFTALE